MRKSRSSQTTAEHVPKIFFDVNRAFQSCDFPNDLWKHDPDPISYARWFACANRIIRLYLNDENTSDGLKTIVTFILKYFIQISFQEKYSKYIADGLIETFRCLPNGLKNFFSCCWTKITPWALEKCNDFNGFWLEKNHKRANVNRMLKGS